MREITIEDSNITYLVSRMNQVITRFSCQDETFLIHLAHFRYIRPTRSHIDRLAEKMLATEKKNIIAALRSRNKSPNCKKFFFTCEFDPVYEINQFGGMVIRRADVLAKYMYSYIAEEVLKMDGNLWTQSPGVLFPGV